MQVRGVCRVALRNPRGESKSTKHIPSASFNRRICFRFSWTLGAARSISRPIRFTVLGEEIPDFDYPSPRRPKVLNRYFRWPPIVLPTLFRLRSARNSGILAFSSPTSPIELRGHSYPVNIAKFRDFHKFPFFQVTIQTNVYVYNFFCNLFSSFFFCYM